MSPPSILCQASIQCRQIKTYKGDIGKTVSPLSIFAVHLYIKYVTIKYLDYSEVFA